MQDSFQSSLIFFRAHKGAVTLLIVSLSLVFFACLILHSLSRITFLEVDKYRPEYSRTYEINYDPADQEMTEKVLEYLHHSGFPIEDLNIRGKVILINPSRVETGDSDVTDFSTGALITSYDMGSKASFTLIGYDNKPSTPMSILRGTDQPGEDGVLVDGFSCYPSLFGTVCFYSGENDDTIYLANGETRDVAGVIHIPSPLFYSGILVDRSEFFSMTDTSTSMQVVFVSDLTEAEEKQILQNVGQYVSIVDVVFPADHVQSIENESNILTLFSRILILICMLCSMRLMTYLFLLRKQEFSIIRMLGASHTRIVMQILAMILMVSGISISIGTIAYLILEASHAADLFLPRLPLQLIGSDALFTLFSALLIGLVAFLTNRKVDVGRANEEV